MAHRKINAQALNLATMPAIPNNSALLVISAPAVPLLAGETDNIKRYIERGGNLLLLTEPDHRQLTVLLNCLGYTRFRELSLTAVRSFTASTIPAFYS